MGIRFDETFVADNDLDSYQYHIVVNSKTNLVDRVATSGLGCIGVLQNKPKSGEHADVTLVGRCRVIAGGTIAGGGEFMSTASGTATDATSGGYILGTALTSVASGGIFTGLLSHAGYKS